MDLCSRIPRPFQRRLARWFGRRPVEIRPKQAVVSFTFDDFPRSALFEGGAILREHGFRATYYASFGLMGQSSPSGGIFCRKDFDQFLLQGHELGCHTFDHCDSWNTAPAEFEASILRNQQIVARELPTLNMRSLSYPISYPRPQTKCRVAKHFRCARFGGQIFNKGFTDLNYLKSFLIEQSRDDFAAIQGMIQANFSNRGWLIFTTHDVCASPSRFGCTPALFAKIVNSVSRSGATVLPVNEAFSAILGRPLPSQC